MKKVIFLSICISLLLSCNREETNPSEEQQTLKSIHAGILTKAYDTTWETDDEIGVFMLAAEEKALPYVVSNRKYINNQGGTVFNPASGDNLIFFPANSSRITFKGYYPYRENLDNDKIYPVYINEQRNLPAIDLMTSEKSAEFSKADQDIFITFYHRLVKLIFEFTVEDYLSISLTDFDLILEAVPTKGTYDILDDILTIDQTSKTDLSFVVRNQEETEERTGIVLPHPAGEPISIRLFNPQNLEEFTTEIPANLELEKGYEYRFRLRVTATPIELHLEQIIIHPWNEEDGGELIMTDK